MKVILPQAIKIIIPPLTSQLLSLIKNSSIVSVIAILDLVAVGRNLIADTFLVFEVWSTIAIIYFIINFILTFFIRLLKKSIFIPQHFQLMTIKDKNKTTLLGNSSYSTPYIGALIFKFY